MRVGHETIYRQIRRDKQAGGDLWRHTRILSKFGRKRYRSHDSRGVLPGKLRIPAKLTDESDDVDRVVSCGAWRSDFSAVGHHRCQS